MTDHIVVDTEQLANMTDEELCALAFKLNMSIEDSTRDEVLSKILNCAVKVG